jgi:hypothetical protein
MHDDRRHKHDAGENPMPRHSLTVRVPSDMDPVAFERLRFQLVLAFGSYRLSRAFAGPVTDVLPLTLCHLYTVEYGDDLSADISPLMQVIRRRVGVELDVVLPIP